MCYQFCIFNVGWDRTRSHHFEIAATNKIDIFWLLLIFFSLSLIIFTICEIYYIKVISLYIHTNQHPYYNCLLFKRHVRVNTWPCIWPNHIISCDKLFHRNSSVTCPTKIFATINCVWIRHKHVWFSYEVWSNSKLSHGEKFAHNNTLLDKKIYMTVNPFNISHSPTTLPYRSSLFLHDLITICHYFLCVMSTFFNLFHSLNFLYPNKI